MSTALFALRSFYDFLRKGGVMKGCPPRLLSTRKIPKRLPRSLSEDAIKKLLAAAESPRDLALLEFLYATGCRVAEASNMNVEDVCFSARSAIVRRGKGAKDRIVLFGRPAAKALTAYLNGRTSGPLFKNGEGRVVPLTAETKALLASCISGKKGDDAVFMHQGRAVKDFCGSWAAATEAAGCPGLLFHDLRRSAVRNMVRSGVPEVVCMRISGHKTRSVFDRYNIVSTRDLEEAAQKIENVSVSYSQAKVAESEEKTKALQNVTIQ